MSYAQATLVQRIRWHLGDMPWETTGSAADASTPYIAVANGTDWTKGRIGEFVTDGDTFYTSDVVSNTLTTVRSYYGSTGASHAASSRILQDPKFKFKEITNAISTIIEMGLAWPRFYKVTSDTITPDAANKVWYDLAADALALVRVNQLYGQTDRKNIAYGGRHEYDRVGFKRGLSTTLVASGVGVTFPDGFRHATNTVSIDYAAKITDTLSGSSYTDLTAGDAIIPAIEFGAVALLNGSLELRKPRHAADEIDNLRGAQQFNQLYHRALNTAEKEIMQKNPLMRDWSK